MLEFVRLLLQKRRFNAITIAVVINLLLVCVLAPLAEPRGASALARIQTSNANQNTNSAYSSPNVVTDGMAAMAQGSEHAVNAAGVKFLGAGVSLASGVTYFDKSVGHGTEATAGFILNGTVKSVAFTGRAAGKAASSSFALATYPVRHFPNLTHLVRLGSIIRPENDSPTPTITQLRIQQAAIIQAGTKDLSVLPANIGSGGACDAGMGNGGYPMSWCNAPMDSIQTVSYSGDAINRECTSYAYWYFTAIEDHTDFHVTGNAKYWAGTSNYPTHGSPAVGAIAVETAGAFGHVAIVRGLPGQMYAGQPIPVGYVLVSEMNYDWNGHFRYSYSPLGKFSAYIYP